MFFNEMLSLVMNGVDRNNLKVAFSKLIVLENCLTYTSIIDFDLLKRSIIFIIRPVMIKNPFRQFIKKKIHKLTSIFLYFNDSTRKQ